MFFKESQYTNCGDIKIYLRNYMTGFCNVQLESTPNNS